MKKYGLLHIKTQTILSHSTSEPDAESDLSTIHYLEVDSSNSNMWLVPNPSLANLVRLNPADEYTSDSQYPVHNFKPDELEVVVVEIKTEPIKNIPEYTYLNFLQDLKKSYQDIYKDKAAVQMTERDIQTYLKDKEIMSPTALDKKYRIPLFRLSSLNPTLFK